MSDSKRFIFGEWIDGSQPVTQSEAELICEKAQNNVALLQSYPMDKIFTLFDELGAKWRDPNFPPRVELLESLPKDTGFSKEMLTLAMDEIVWMLESTRLKKKVHTELRGLAPGEEGQFDPVTNTQMRWSPLGVVFHVLSGNVFLVGLGSLIEGLITGNVTILKMSSGEKRFLPTFIKTLQDCDRDGVVSRSIALVDYPSSSTEVIETFKTGSDGILVWGGEQAVRAYRNGLSAGKKFIMYGPKLSLGVVTENGLSAFGKEAVSEKLAMELAIWDQNACTAPQVCYVQGESNARALADSLALALEKKAVELPAGPADTNVAVEIQKMRGVAEIAEARGDGVIRESRGDVDWTVIVDGNQTIEPSPLHRTIRLIPFTKLEEVIAQGDSIRGYLQTVGLIADKAEWQTWFESFSEIGALKVVELGNMSGGEIDDPHDGAYDLPQFGHFVVGRFPTAVKGGHPTDLLPLEARQKLIDGRLRVLLSHAQKSKFYKDRLTVGEVDCTADLGKVPVLTREEMEANMPPQGQGLGTGLFDGGGYVSRSGGSTGEPKFSVYDNHDWDRLVSHATRVLRGAGVEKGDRVANYMMSGDLYGSFVSFDHINHAIGAQSFAFAGHVCPETFLKMWKNFGLNVIQAIPARLIMLFRKAKEIDPSFTFEKVVYAGTPLSRSDYDWLKSECQVKRISSVIGANDGGQLAFQCEHQSGSTHHLVDDFNFVEILDSNGSVVPDGTSGTIVITSLLKFAYPLIRYELGDAGKIVPGQCPCGRTTRVMEYLGRADDTVCLGLMNVQYRDLVTALEGFPISGLQMVISNSAKGEIIQFNVETDQYQRTELADEMKEALFSKEPLVKKELDQGTIYSLTFKLCAIGTLTRNQTSGKLKTVVDERN